MPSLKEIKARIASVGNTLKITSAMKMVSSAKLRKAQDMVGNMLSYQQALQDILSKLLGDRPLDSEFTRQRGTSSVALLCFSSNSSLCGAFNSNVIKEARHIVSDYLDKSVSLTVYSVGRKISDAMRKDGFPSPSDFAEMSARPTYARVSELADSLAADFLSHKYDKAELVYNHFKSTVSQIVTRETFLPLSIEDESEKEADYIVEPDGGSLLGTLLPTVIRLKLYAVMLDTATAEHAARTLAMQTASDNGKVLLQDLTLQYNKSRQQKITSEILDIVGGSQI